MLASTKYNTRKFSSNTSGSREAQPALELKAVGEVVTDSVKMGNEQLQGLISREIRDQLFANMANH